MIKEFWNWLFKKKDSGYCICKYENTCHEKCGHKIVHLKNTGCLNFCIYSGLELSCVACDEPEHKELGVC